jgi:hypothetical protein
MLRAEVQLREPLDQLSLLAWALRRDGSVKFRSQPWCDDTGIFAASSSTSEGRAARRRTYVSELLKWSTKPLLHVLAAAKPQVIIGMAMVIHDTRAMPERCAPAAPVFVRAVQIEHKPASFQLRVT